jgi:hypothetical protein
VVKVTGMNPHLGVWSRGSELCENIYQVLKKIHSIFLRRCIEVVSKIMFFRNRLVWPGLVNIWLKRTTSRVENVR